MSGMTDLEIVLFAAVVVLVIGILYFRHTSELFYERWRTRQTDANTMGTRQVMGDISQVLGTFAVLGHYEQVILLSITSTQSSMDLVGVKGDSLDFIELKKKGASLGTAERNSERR